MIIRQIPIRSTSGYVLFNLFNYLQILNRYLLTYLLQMDPHMDSTGSNPFSFVSYYKILYYLSNSYPFYYIKSLLT